MSYLLDMLLTCAMIWAWMFAGQTLYWRHPVAWLVVFALIGVVLTAVRDINKMRINARKDQP